MVNNKVYSETKISLFMANYSRKLRMEADIRKKRKVEKVTEFVERIKKVQEEAKVACKQIRRENKVKSRRRRIELY